MDTLSGSVSTLKVHGLHSTSRELYHFKTSSSASIIPCSASKPNLISNKTTSFSPKPFTLTPIFLSPSPTLSSTSSSSPTLHRKPASGYAAALLGIAQSNGSIDPVEKDVQRLLKLLRNKQIQAVLGDPFVGEKHKGLVVMELTKKGMFNRHLVSLVKMLVRKNKAGLMEQVLEEFERIYDELSGTEVVLVSSAKKMEEDQLSGIAKRVQSLTGAVKVKVLQIWLVTRNLSFIIAGGTVIALLIMYSSLKLTNFAVFILLLVLINISGAVGVLPLLPARS